MGCTMNPSPKRQSKQHVGPAAAPRAPVLCASIQPLCSNIQPFCSSISPSSPPKQPLPLQPVPQLVGRCRQPCQDISLEYRE